MKKCAYGMKKAGIIVYLQLVGHMDGIGCYPIPCNTGLWEHHTLATKFFLCVNDLGVKCFSKDEADNLLNELKKHYVVCTDWKVFFWF